MGFRRILAVISFLALSPAAHAANQVGVLGGLSVTGASLDTGTSPNTLSGSSKVSFKTGVGAEYDIVPALVSMELDLLYAKYQWERSTTGVALATETSTSWWEFPIFANYIGIPQFKFGLGPVFDFASGQVHTENSDGTLAQDQSYGAASSGTTSVGLAFQAGYTYAFSGPWTLNVDLRYVMGLTNLSQTSPATAKIHSVDLLAGVAFAF